MYLRRSRAHAEPPPPPAALPDAAARPGERGVVMVVVLAMMGILTLLASAAALRTSMDMREGGAERLGRAAFRVSEAGTYAVVSLAAQMQGGFGDYVAGKTGGKLSMVDVGDEVLALTGKDQSFGKELAAVGAVDFSTLVGQADSASTPGYEAGRYCFRTYRMVTTSRIGATNPANLRESMVAGQTRLAATMTLGPMPCGN